jgi:putative SOS response-associated peptidase YedK
MEEETDSTMRPTSLKPDASVVQEDGSGYYPALTWLHERMPVVIDYDLYDLWLDRSTPDIADLTELLLPYPAEGLEAYPVSPKVNRTGMDMPELLEAVSGARA